MTVCNAPLVLIVQNRLISLGHAKIIMSSPGEQTLKTVSQYNTVRFIVFIHGEVYDFRMFQRHSYKNTSRYYWCSSQLHNYLV